MRGTWRLPLVFAIAACAFVVLAGALAASSGHPVRALLLSGGGSTAALCLAGYGVWREHQ